MLSSSAFIMGKWIGKQQCRTMNRRVHPRRFPKVRERLRASGACSSRERINRNERRFAATIEVAERSESPFGCKMRNDSKERTILCHAQLRFATALIYGALPHALSGAPPLNPARVFDP